MKLSYLFTKLKKVITTKNKINRLHGQIHGCNVHADFFIRNKNRTFVEYGSIAQLVERDSLKVCQS